MQIPPDWSQSQVFSNRVLPSLFHGSPEEFIRLLYNDGTKFLQFYWKQAGEKLPASQARDSFGLNYDFREPWQGALVSLVRMPQPLQDGETHFVALIYRPGRRLLFVSDTSKVVTLEQAAAPEGQEPTRLVEWDRRIARVELGPGPPARQEDFYQAVTRLLED